jgi:hypothetical protein
MRRRIAGLCGSLAFLLVGACTLITPLDGLSDDAEGSLDPGQDAGPRGSDGGPSTSDGSTIREDGAPPEGDAGDDVTDGGALVDAKQDVQTGPPNLVSNGSFETLGNGCGPGWRATSQTSAAPSAPARSGSKSCKVCNLGGPDTTIGVIYDVGEGQWGPGSYTLTAYVRAETGDSILGIDQLTVTKAGVHNYVGNNANATDTAWQLLKYSTTIGASESITGILVGGNAGKTNQCVYVDDVQMIRQ